MSPHTPTPKIQAVPKEDDHPSAQMMSPFSERGSRTTNAVAILSMVLWLSAIVVGWVYISSVSSHLETQNKSITKQTKAIEALQRARKELTREVVTLRQVIGSQTKEDIVFLKILILNRKVRPELARVIAKSVHRNALIFKRDPDLVLAIIHVESNFDPNAVSSMKAVGLMQVMPHWVDQLGIMGDLKDPDTSIRYGLQIYGFYDSMYKDMETSLMAYNRGPGRVDSDLMVGRDPSRNGYAKRIMKSYKSLKGLNIEVDDTQP